MESMQRLGVDVHRIRPRDAHHRNQHQQKPSVFRAVFQILSVSVLFTSHTPYLRCVVVLIVFWGVTMGVQSADKPIEIYQRIEPTHGGPPRLALTLDACSGQFDADLIDFLVRNRLPATVFATQKWILKNPAGVGVLKAHLDLFDVEDHGENHIPAVIGTGRKVYGIPGQPDIVHLRREILEGAKAIEKTFGVAPHWYRGATAVYDAQAAREIKQLGYKVAGFSVNGDEGATLQRQAIANRLMQVKDGDVIIAHMNKPTGDTAEGMTEGLTSLLRRGFQFVRLDQVELVDVRTPPRSSSH